MTESEKPKWLRHRYDQPIDKLLLYGPTMIVDVCAVAGGDKLRVRAQIDTGAHGTAISPRIIERLGLKPTPITGMVDIAGLGETAVTYYAVHFILPNMELQLDAFGFHIGGLHDVLIGRDILKYYRLAVDFTSGRVELHFRQGA